MPAPDKILLIANNFPPVQGGSAVVYDAIARGAASRVTVLAPNSSYADGLPLIGWREHDRRAPYEITRLPLLRTRIEGPHRGALARIAFLAHDISIRLRIMAMLVRRTRRGGIGAVCIGELVSSAWLLELLRRWSKLRRVVYVHGEEITTRDSYDPDWRRRRRALACADTIIVVSHFTEAAVRKLVEGHATPEIRLIENGVDYCRFANSTWRDDLAARYGLEGRFVFVSVCRLLEKKGIDHAIRAFAALHREDSACRFLVVGTGPYAATLVAIAAEEGVADAVVFAGAVADADLADHYRLGDVFVMPNRALPSGDTEGFGLVFLEANAAGLPVIAGRDGGSGDAVTDGVNGLVIDGNAVEAIAAAMRRLRESPALRAEIAERGRASAAAADWSIKARAFLAACLDGDDAR